jgi:hypothetical protein
VCLLTEAPLVASGTVRVRSLVTDATGSGPGATAIHATVQGIVDLTSGGEARLLATGRVVITPDGSLHFDVEHVQLTPR